MLYGSNTDIEPHIIDAKNAYLLIEIVKLLLSFPISQNM